MKVLFVNASLEAVRGGGTAERTYALARTFARLGEPVTVLTTDIGDGHRRLERTEGISLTVLHSMLDRFYLPAPQLRRVHAAVASADIVHLMNHWTAINALAYWSARIAGRPYVFSPAGALPVFGRSRHIKAAYNAVVGRSIARHAARCVAITSAEVAQFQAYGVPAGKVTVIPNGVDMDEAAATGAGPLPALAGKPYVFFIGRLNPIKGPDLLLEAFLSVAAEFPALQLVLAGPDEGLETSLRAAAAPATARVHFAGPVTGDAKRWLLQHAQLVAIPSRQEAMSIVALEAGAAGRPVLLTDQCGFPEVAACGGGRVVPASAAALAQGMREMLAPQTPLGDMGERLRRLVKKHYTWDAAALAMRNCFATAIEEAGTR